MSMSSSSSSLSMEFRWRKEYSYSKSSSEETDDETGNGRSYECVFCKRGFTTAQALGGHMNIHRKDRAKPSFVPPSTSSSSKVDDNNYADLGFYPTHLYCSTAPHEVDANNSHHLYFSAPACGTAITPSHVQFNQDWKHRNLSLYTDQLCVRQNYKDNFEGKNDEDGLDLELRLGHHP